MDWTSESEMTLRTVLVEARELAFVRHALEASEGLGFVVAEKGGPIVVAATKSCAEELDVFLEDMASVAGLVVMAPTEGNAKKEPVCADG